MSKYPTLVSTLGNTPLVFLEKYSEKYNAHFFVKLEYMNPSFSIKDRVAFEMLQGAFEEGKISEGGTIIEATSGNTGIGLALAAKFFNLKLILVMPETMSIERRQILYAYGAELVLTSGDKGMAGAVEKAMALVGETPFSYMPNQFSNPYCIQAHYKNTAPEIEKQLHERKLKLDAFIAGVGTGGTISGIGSYFKERDANTTIIAVEPSTSAVLSGEEAGKHGIQGIGAGFIPDNYKKEVVDEVYKVSTEQAIEAARNLMDIEGISCGISSGANIFSAVEYAKKYLQKTDRKKTIVTVIPDDIYKYFSTPLVRSIA